MKRTEPAASQHSANVTASCKRRRTSKVWTHCSALAPRYYFLRSPKYAQQPNYLICGTRGTQLSFRLLGGVSLLRLLSHFSFKDLPSNANPKSQLPAFEAADSRVEASTMKAGGLIPHSMIRWHGTGQPVIWFDVRSSLFICILAFHPEQRCFRCPAAEFRTQSFSCCVAAPRNQ
jgi:hypothetical protein